jgi:hypothetical protein
VPEAGQAPPLPPPALHGPAPTDPASPPPLPLPHAGSVAAFLHENVLHFIDDDAAADAAGCLDALSAADVLASSRQWGGAPLRPPPALRVSPPVWMLATGAGPALICPAPALSFRGGNLVQSLCYPRLCLALCQP